MVTYSLLTRSVVRGGEWAYRFVVLAGAELAIPQVR
jgi:hypothetical protein